MLKIIFSQQIISIIFEPVILPTNAIHKLLFILALKFLYSQTTFYTL